MFTSEEIERFRVNKMRVSVSFGRNVSVLWNLNARVGNEEIEGLVGRYGVAGRNESAWNGYRRFAQNVSLWFETICSGRKVLYIYTLEMEGVFASAFANNSQKFYIRISGCCR